MARTLNELTMELKDFILDYVNDPRSRIKVKHYEYNSLEIKMDRSRETAPHIIVSLGISEAMFSIKTGKKISGGLGPDEKYVLKWLTRGIVIQKLNDTWKLHEFNAIKTSTQNTEN